MQDIYQTFEFNKIKESILDFSKTELGKEYVSNLKMLESEEEVISKKALLNEISSIILRFGPFPISNSANALNIILMAKKTAILTPRDLYLLSNDVETITLINKYLNKVDTNYPLISELKEKFYDLSPLYKEIRRVITTSFTVYDNATSELKRIRNSIKKAEDDLLNKTSTLAYRYSLYTEDSNPTIRDGHFVLPIKSIYKHKVSGIVYDVSSTGNTTFIEPIEIVELNNRITELKVEENEEVRKILKGLTNLVLLQENEILNNNKLIALIDFNSAKAMYGEKINGIIAEHKKDQCVNMIKARHPLIDPNKVVSNDYYIDENKRIVIISGPNAGGKTVSLKTVGLIILMNQAGLMVPCLKCELSYFKNIYIDIGDNQSLSDNLSTFSAHMTQIGEIMRVIKGKDLILLDELGTGTDPKEGEAIALSIVKYLETKHCLGMISSHFNALKEYAFSSNNLENSSMIFDKEKLLPTYIFKLGVPGKSYGLDVASRFGIDEALINSAKEYIKNNNSEDSASLLNILQDKMKALAINEDNLNKKQIELDRLEKQLRITQDNLNNRKDKLLEEVKKEKEQYIEKTIEKVNDIIKNLSSTDLKLHEVVDIKKRVEELKDVDEEIIYDEDIKLDDFVSYPALNIQGKVVGLKGNKANILGNDGITYAIETNKLTVIPMITKAPKTSRKNYDIKINPNIGLELNIIGLRRDEAQDKLIKYIDDCRMKSLKNVRIIHGYGSGILRKMVHEYLSKQKDLTFRLGGAYEGGSGATAVEFKHDGKN